MGPFLRVGLAEMTTLTPSHVGVVVWEAMKHGLLIERGFAPSSGGWHRTLVEVNPEFATLLGVSIGRAHIRTVVPDVMGKILNYKWLPAEESRG
jgi:hypothetical protein